MGYLMTTYTVLSLTVMICLIAGTNIIRTWNHRWSESRRADAERRLEDLRWRLQQRERQQAFDRIR